MRVLRTAVLILLICASLPLYGQQKKVYFSVSTDRTFLPGEKPKVRIYARNVERLEFRVYKVRDPQKFFKSMSDLHRYGPQYAPVEDIDEKTPIERFHDWKHRWWVTLRRFVRDQFSSDSRDAIRERHSRNAEIQKGEATEFARVPLLNPAQLVSRWKVQLPSTLVSQSSDIPVETLEPGAYLVEVTDGEFKAYTVLLVSKMVVVTKSSAGQMLAFTADRATGKPIPNVDVMLWRKKTATQIRTDQQGLGEIHLPADQVRAEDATPEYEDGEFVLATHENDVALVAPYYSSFSLSSNPAADWLGYVYTDRPVYRPGHTVQFKAILRKRNGDAIELPKEREARVEITDSAQSVVLRKQLPLSSMGTLHGSLDIPENAALGSYSIQVIVGKGNAYGNFEVEEYKKPEYWVKVTPDAPRVLQNDEIRVSIEARYFFGEPVANAKVKYVVHTSPKYYWENDEMPEGMEEGVGESDGDYAYDREQIEEQEGKLDANGRLVVTIPTKLDPKKLDQTYRIEARVTDAGNREVAGHNSALATYGSYRVQIEAQSYIYKPNDTAEFKIKCLDYDDHPLAKPVKVELIERQSDRTEKILQTVDATTGAEGTAKVSIPITQSGSLTARVTSRTPEGRDVTSETWLWVTGVTYSGWSDEDRQIQLVADKPSYKVGDTAHVLVMDVAQDASLLVTSEGRTILTKELITAKGTQQTIDIPITKESQPNLFVNVLFIYKDKVFSGKKSLKVPPIEQKLNLEIKPSKAQFIPGEAASYTVTATDFAGKPVQAELSFGVVDDAIYGVRPDMSGDIVNAFFQQRYGEVVTYHSLDFHFNGQAGQKTFELANAFRASRRSALAQIKSGDLVQPKIRKAFPDTAYWAADVKTDATGHAKVQLSFPDSLTTWRTTVRAITADSKAGATINKVIVRKNLILRLAVPRFFRQGDDVTVSTIVHNYLDTTKATKISLEATGILLTDPGARDVSIPNRGEVKVDWHLKTVPGKEVKLLAKALTNEESDAMELTLPIIPFGVKQAIARSGAVSENSGTQKAALEFPANAEVNARGIDVELSSSVAGGIFGALEYLTSFPYGCTEQTMSSFLPNVVVAKTLAEMKLKNSINPATLKRQVNAGLERLYDFQHEDGGWGWWKEDASTVFMTAYVLSGLTQANEAGYEVQSHRVANAKEFLHKSLREHPNMIADLRAYVVFALAQSGDRDRGALDSVWDKRDKLSSEGLAFAGLAMRMNNDHRSAEAAGTLRSQAKTEGDAVYWPAKNDYLLDVDTDNSAEGTAYVVKLLSEIDANDPLLPKAVMWLMRHRDEGYFWSSTKQTAMIVYGIVDYMKVSKELEPNFDGEVLVNGRSVLKRHFASSELVDGGGIRVHLDEKQVQSKNDVEIRKSGAGRLYWSVRAPYYSTDKKLYTAGTYALNIARDYFRLDKATVDGRILYNLKPLDSAVNVGDVLAVRVTVSGSRWRYLLVEDPIPAGTEFIERDDLYELSTKPSWWSWYFERREFHDDRAAFFQSYFDRQQQYVYLLKVVNPGQFKISPASVQPMYQPDVLSTTEPTSLEVK